MEPTTKPAGLAALLLCTAALGRADLWVRIEPTPDSQPSAIAVAGTDVYEANGAGFFRSSDGGRTWSTGGAGLPTGFGVGALAVDPRTLPPALCPAPCSTASGSLLYAGTSGAGVFRSSDRGETWSSANGTGLTNLSVTTLAVDAAGAVYVATDGGLFKSSDFGASWAPRNSGLEGLVVSSLVPDPESSSVIYAAATLSVFPVRVPEVGRGVLRSTDGGEHWVPKNNGLTDLYVLSVASAPDSATVYAGTAFRGVFRSGDRGETWVPANVGLQTGIPCLAADPRRPSTLYAGTGILVGTFGRLFGSGVFQSPNQGETWTPISEGLQQNPIGIGEIYALAIDPAARNLYAAVLQAGLFRRELTSEVRCGPAATTLCLSSDRFRVEVSWRSSNVGGGGSGQALPLTTDTGAFWFFQPSNIELVVKVLDGRTVNGKFWVFYGALSNVEYTITVTDTVSGTVKTYFNPEGNLASVADTDAF